MEASTRDRLRPAHRLAREVLLPPLLAGAAIVCLLLAVAVSFGQRGVKANNPLAPQQSTPEEITQQLTLHLEGIPSPADIRRAQKPLTERQRLLNAHPYFALYKIAAGRFGVSWHLVAAVHYQETGFGEAPATLAQEDHWRRHRTAADAAVRPATYPNRSRRHPSVKDDFDVVMAIAANLRAGGARGVGERARRAVALRYGSGPDGGLSTAMVIERARAWRMLGTLPLPGRGELATPTKGVVGGCGYFGCPRPGHLHNGVDFLAPTGTPIHAADSGAVAIVQSPGASGGYGNFACLQHRPHLATCYAHMSAFAAAVRPGARVRRGQVIGLVGSTGHSTAPHLHFEVRRGRADCSACAVDPFPLLSGDVPAAALPRMAAGAPSTRAATSSAAPPVAPASAPAPGDAGHSGGARPEGEEPPATGAPRGRSPSAAGDRAAPETGGAAPDASTRPRPRPAPAPATPPPAAEPAPAPATQVPAPAPPAGKTGTGGAASPESPPPPPPPPAADASAPPPA